MQTDELGKFIMELMPRLAADESIVALEIYKGLAGSTISVAALGDHTGLAPSRVEAIVSPWPGVFRDERRDIVGFWELTAQPSASTCYESTASPAMLGVPGTASSYRHCSVSRCRRVPSALKPANQSS
jgi:hypothetical protein